MKPKRKTWPRHEQDDKKETKLSSIRSKCHAYSQFINCRKYEACCSNFQLALFNHICTTIIIDFNNENIHYENNKDHVQVITAYFKKKKL